VLDIFQVTKTQMVDLVREVKGVSSHNQSRESLRIVMATDMEISGHLVDEDKACESASLLIAKGLDGGIQDLLATSLTLRRRMPVLIKLLLFGILISVTIFIDMLHLANDIAILVQTILV
jgi:hypothetical protein